MQHNLQDNADNKCVGPIEGFATVRYIVKAVLIAKTFQNIPKRFAIVIINIPIPTLFCGINWHGPSCKNFAKPKDEESIDRINL